MPEAMNKEATNQPIEFDAIQIGLASPENDFRCHQDWTGVP